MTAEPIKRYLNISKLCNYRELDERIIKSFTTNGDTIHISFEKLLSQDKAKQESTMLLKDYDLIVAWDPGFKLPIAMVCATSFDLTKPQFNIQFLDKFYKRSSNGYYHDIGHKRHQHYRNKRTGKHNKAMQAARIAMNGPDVNHLWRHSIVDYERFTEFELANFEQHQNINRKRRYANNKFHLHVYKPKVIDAYFKKIIGNAKNVLVFKGDAHFAANSPIKGYIKGPQNLLVNRLKRKAKVVEVNEYCTSRVCFDCGTKCEKPKKRILHCHICNKNVNRDENAAKNMMLKGIAQEAMKEATTDEKKKEIMEKVYPSLYRSEQKSTTKRKNDNADNQPPAKRSKSSR